MNLKLTALLVGAVILAGCGASTPYQHQYKPAHSHAKNVADAAGFGHELSDHRVPSDKIGDIRDSAVWGAGFTLAGYMAPPSGITPGTSAGLNLLSWVLSPEKKSAKTRLLGWQPKNGQDSASARKALMASISSAAEQTALEYGIETYTYWDEDGYRAHVFMKQPDERCENKEYCLIFTFGLDDAKVQIATPKIASHGLESHFYDPREHYSYFSFNKAYFGFNEVEYIQKMSSKLPDWFYLYSGPKQLKLDRENKMMAPVMVANGKISLFIIPG